MQHLDEIKDLIVKTVSQVPGVLPDPRSEALVAELSDVEANSVKLRVLWWTKAPRQHEMLTSYDSVLTAIGQVFSHQTEDKEKSRAA
jgi:hypothetical protein